jgi:hypothetical protein
MAQWKPYNLPKANEFLKFLASSPYQHLRPMVRRRAPLLAPGQSPGANEAIYRHSLLVHSSAFREFQKAVAHWRAQTRSPMKHYLGRH